MGNVVAEFTLSLDGFIADARDDIRQLFGWYSSGDTEFSSPGLAMTFKIHRASAELLRETWGSVGALVTGRRDFDVSNAWGGASPLNVPIYIVTHHVPQAWADRDAPFTFVTEGVESAIRQAQQAANGKVVGVSGSKIVQQALQAGLVDEIQIHLAPILLGEGIRLFDHLGPQPRNLEILRVIDTPSVTHLRYRVLKLINQEK